MSINTNENSKSIIEIMKEVDLEHFVLPEYQRDFVWEIEKTHDLFDSIIREIFIGHIILGVPSFEITVRELDNRPRKGKGSRKKLKMKHLSEEKINKIKQKGQVKLILDGQQRITSLYRSLKGVDPAWIVIKSKEELIKEYDTDNMKKLELEQLLYRVSSREDEERISIRVADVYTAMDERYREKEIESKIFDNSNESNKCEDEDTLQKRIDDFLECFLKIKELFNRESILSYYLLDMTEEKFALFFERSNSKGIQLSFIDILNAKLFYGFNFKKRFDEFVDENNILNYKFKKEVIVRSIAVIVSKYKNISRKYILTALKAEHFNDLFDDVCIIYKRVIEYLSANHFIISQQWMPYETMIIPLICFTMKLKGKEFSEMTEGQNRFINYWYWASIFSKRYSGGTNEIILLDSYVLSNLAQGEKIDNRSYFSKLSKIEVINYEDLYPYKKSSAIYKGVLNLINYQNQGLLDWSNSRKLSFNEKLDDHHIFPVKFLENGNYKEQDIENMDCVINRALIPKITNIKIGKKAPSDYLKELENKNGNLEKSLESHFLSTDLYDGTYDDVFEIFLEERGKVMIKEINNVLADAKIIEESFTLTVKESLIEIFGTYYNEKQYAKFNLRNKKVWINSKSYSVSESAKVAKGLMGAKKDVSTNGWTFWKYIDDNGNEKRIDILRNV